ncbi:STAS domain-containing protein [Actinoplanes sp. NEAU-A12]|uniref:STAS domain-containing protein n=1 Tax=Actinoplanes sandaracinus TaxID=3045177 RepID=A0ABT6WSM7_9ACTN|nr:STAS domain-containing protein [Actinoplanes sandaracinus]
MAHDYFTIASHPAGADADGVVTSRVQLAGEFDIDSRDELAGRLLGIVEADAAARIVVDLHQVTFIDSEAIGALIEGHLAADRAGIAFRLASADGVVKRVLTVVGLDYLFDPPPAHG